MNSNYTVQSGIEGCGNGLDPVSYEPLRDPVFRFNKICYNQNTLNDWYDSVNSQGFAFTDPMTRTPMNPPTGFQPPFEGIDSFYYFRENPNFDPSGDQDPGDYEIYVLMGQPRGGFFLQQLEEPGRPFKDRFSFMWSPGTTFGGPAMAIPMRSQVRPRAAPAAPARLSRRADAGHPTLAPAGVREEHAEQAHVHKVPVQRPGFQGYHGWLCAAIGAGERWLGEALGAPACDDDSIGPSVYFPSERVLRA